jgi:hypothetical protein
MKIKPRVLGAREFLKPITWRTLVGETTKANNTRFRRIKDTFDVID